MAALNDAQIKMITNQWEFFFLSHLFMIFLIKHVKLKQTRQDKNTTNTTNQIKSDMLDIIQ